MWNMLKDYLQAEHLQDALTQPRFDGVLCEAL